LNLAAAEAVELAKSGACAPLVGRVFSAASSASSSSSSSSSPPHTQAKAAGVTMTQKNKEASVAIYHHRNDGKGDLYIDLHGLYVEEALGFTKEKLAELTKRKGCDLELITGAGHHSADHVAHIKGKVIDLLKEKGMQFSEKNAGELLVHY
jgi:DNA-nicking Smr family endonuclease